MPFAKSGSTSIHYEFEGPSGAPALVFSNSLGANCSMWSSQAQEFGKTFRVLRYDTRGHGQSSSPSGPYSIEQLSKDVLYLLDELRLDRAHFCGLSMGGMIGMWLGANAPERLHKLVLCNTGATIGTAESWQSRIDAVLKNGMAAVAPAVLERWFTPSFHRANPSAIAAARRMIEQADPQGYAACCAAIRDFDSRAKLATIRTPTLVMAGAHDPATPPADGRFIADHIPGARYLELDSAHISNVEQRDRFNSELSNFLES
jgi:3-oxoadipate enol-lactonase